jgi:hypothetical protein
MPLCPPRFRTRRRGRDEGPRSNGRTDGRTNERGGSFFFTGDEAGPCAALTCAPRPTCGPFPRAVRFDVVFFKAVFTELGPYPAFFRSQKWLETIQHGRARLFLRSLPLSLSHVFSPSPPSFFSFRKRAVREHCAFSGAFQSQWSPLWPLIVGRSSSSIASILQLVREGKRVPWSSDLWGLIRSVCSKSNEIT